MTIVVVLFGEGGDGNGEDNLTVGGVYKQVFQIFFLPSIRTLCVVLLTCKIAFIGFCYLFIFPFSSSSSDFALPITKLLKLMIQ